MRYAITALMLFTCTASADTYELAAEKQRICKAHGNLAASVSYNRPEAVEVLASARAKVERDKSDQRQRMIVDTLTTALSASPSTSATDLYMQAWSVCMDKYDI